MALPRRLPLILVLGISLLPLAAAVSPFFALSHDAATYAVLAENLAAGKGYTYQGYAHVKYPPGFPLLLGGVVTVWGRNLWCWRLFTALLGAFSLVLAWRLVRAREGPGIGLAALLAMGFTGFFVAHTTYTLTDVPFLGLVCLACLAGRRFLAHPGPGRALALGGLIALAASFRLVGLLLLPALLAAWFTAPGGRRARRSVLLLLPSLLPLLLLAFWFWYKSRAGPLLSEELRDGATYLGEMRGGLWLDAPRGFLDTLLHQARIRPVILCGTCARFLSGDRFGWGGSWLVGQVSLFSLLCLALVLVAAVRSWWRHRGMLDWFFFLYLALLMVTPPFVGPRYFIPVLPFLLGSLLVGLAELGGAWGGLRKAASAAAGGVILYLILWLPATLGTVVGQHASPPYRGHQAPFVQAASALPPGEVGLTICNEAALVHFLSRSGTAGFPLTRQEEVERWILERGDRVLLSSYGYPVHEKLLQGAARALLARDRLREERRFVAPGGAWTVLFRVVGE